MRLLPAKSISKGLQIGTIIQIRSRQIACNMSAAQATKVDLQDLEREHLKKRLKLESVDFNAQNISSKNDHTFDCSENQSATNGKSFSSACTHDDLEHIKQILASKTPIKSTARLDFRHGLHLAPMVRIGALPTRLLSLQFGANLVWGPEIVDRAIIGCDRLVDLRTGLISYSREGKHIFTTHPVERERLIFQLGSSSPEWAYKAIKFITAHDEVAGVDLNCGCPKSFSTIGGMGAQLLSTPELLCDILRAMRIAAPSHVSVSCKIRLLPTKEETQALIRMIVRTGCIDALTVHCRTKSMRPREPALPDRLEEVKDVIQQETQGALPLIVNGDAWDAGEAKKLMQTTGVTSVMMARGPEGNPSCFSESGVVSVPEVVGPTWAKFAVAFDNQYGNTKYCLQSLALKPSSSIVADRPAPMDQTRYWSKARLTEMRSKITQGKSVEEMAAVFGVNADEIRAKSSDEILEDVKRALGRRPSLIRSDEDIL